LDLKTAPDKPSPLFKPLSFSLLAVLLFLPLFSIQRLGPFDFWWWMAANQILLIGLALLTSQRFRLELSTDLTKGPAGKVALGLLSALILYAVFYAGDIASRFLIPFASRGIDQIYAFKQGASGLRILFLMLLLIGPGEEIFWRGFLQKRWQEKIGPYPAFVLVAFLYAAVHAASGNTMLVLAAAVCGLFWGWLYLRFQSVLLIAVSHTIWDILVFLFLTFEG
jgi:membrane protease YdiL (CAAX protease family)